MKVCGGHVACLVHSYPDGATVHAHPAPAADVVEQLHDLIHELAARAVGLERSPTLTRQAAGSPTAEGAAGNEERALEEAAVAAVSAWLRFRLQLLG